MGGRNHPGFGGDFGHLMKSNVKVGNRPKPNLVKAISATEYIF